MSSPRSVGGASREGTRIVLREITATLQNLSPTQISRRKSGADSSTPTKNLEHEVKVRFTREFADVAYPSAAPGSLSSASSVHSLSSTLSSKSSGGAGRETAPARVSPNNSYANAAIPGLEELIVGCADIRLNSAEESVVQDSQDLSQDQTFASATDEPILLTPRSPSTPSPQLPSPPPPSPPPSPPPPPPPSVPDVKELAQEVAALDVESQSSDCPANAENAENPENPGNAGNEPSKEANQEQPSTTVDGLISDVTLLDASVSPIRNIDDSHLVESNRPDEPQGSSRRSSQISDSRNEGVANEPPPGIEVTTTLKENSPIRADTNVSAFNETISLQSDNVLDLEEDSEAFTAKLLNSTVLLDDDIDTLPEKHGKTINNDTNSTDTTSDVQSGIETGNLSGKDESPEKNFDNTVTLEEDHCLASSSGECLPEDVQYNEFKPQRQSTTLTVPTDRLNFEQFTLAAQEVANDIYNSSFEQTAEGSDRFVSCEVFQDPTSFDFLLARGNSKNTLRDLRAESLYAKFDPLVGGNVSMLPQGNNQTINEDGDGKTENNEPVRHEPVTPKRNPAIAAIDRLLFYSPLPTGAEAKSVETPEKNVPKPDAAVNIDVNMAKELEIVRATVLQLEEELEKQKREHEAELERQSNAFQEKLAKLQAQLAQEVKNKNQMTVVMDEYEKSISRLVSERERDRVALEQEKAKLQEELQAANHHLNNTEAAFNDVHLKYERLKGVVSAYKSNETVLKESIQENVETIKALENRYDQLKSHAMAQLEKANLELDSIKKQHEAETVKLHAMVRKAELKSNSLAELVEQKTKENKELAQILDEVIARVGRQNAE